MKLNIAYLVSFSYQAICERELLLLRIEEKLNEEDKYYTIKIHKMHALNFLFEQCNAFNVIKKITFIIIKLKF